MTPIADDAGRSAVLPRFDWGTYRGTTLDGNHVTTLISMDYIYIVAEEEGSKGLGAETGAEADQRYTAPARLVYCGSCPSVDATNPQVANSKGVRPR